MADKMFKFATEDGSLVQVVYEPSKHRLDKEVAKQRVVSFLEQYGCPGKTVEIFNTSVNGVFRITIKDGLGSTQEIFAGIGNTQTGGNTRPIDEHRIQMSGEIYNDLYQKKKAGKTAVLLGVYYWNSSTMMNSPKSGFNGQYVICAWEPTATESKSPLSKQIKVSCISKAIKTGLAQYEGGVIACAFRPELIYFYLENSDWLTKSKVTSLPSVETDEEFETEVIEERQDSVEGAENFLYYGVPGAGKSFYIDEHFAPDKWSRERVVFHPDYTYSDFVGQILPKVTKTEVDGKLVEKLVYKFVPGPFTKILREAIKNPKNKYCLIIEELNRGNAPAIFGEIFQLLDRTTKGESRYGITNFDIAEYVFKDEEHEIKIPSNLWMLATMNTSDQNVFTLDTAFQRRWIMKNIPNKFEGEHHFDEKIEGSIITWRAFAEVINECVIDAGTGMGSTEDKRLGAFFATERELKADRFPEKVLKYLWDDAFKMDHDYVFSNQMKSLDLVITTFKKGKGDPLGTVLRADVYAKMMEKLKTKTSGEEDAEQNTTE